MGDRPDWPEEDDGALLSGLCLLQPPALPLRWKVSLGDPEKWEATPLGFLHRTARGWPWPVCWASRKQAAFSWYRKMLTVLLFVARAFISGGFQAAYVYTPEVGRRESSPPPAGTGLELPRERARLQQAEGRAGGLKVVMAFPTGLPNRHPCPGPGDMQRSGQSWRPHYTLHCTGKGRATPSGDSLDPGLSQDVSMNRRSWRLLKGSSSDAIAEPGCSC